MQVQNTEHGVVAWIGPFKDADVDNVQKAEAAYQIEKERVINGALRECYFAWGIDSEVHGPAPVSIQGLN